MNTAKESSDKLEQIRKRSEKAREEKAYAARLESIEAQRAAKTTGRGGALLVVVLIFIVLIVGLGYLLGSF